MKTTKGSEKIDTKMDEDEENENKDEKDERERERKKSKNTEKITTKTRTLIKQDGKEIKRKNERKEIQDSKDEEEFSYLAFCRTPLERLTCK